MIVTSRVEYKLAIFFIAITFFIGLSACTPQQESSLRIGTNQWPGYEPLYLARALQFFDSKQIKLIELTSATETMRAFKRHQIDVAALTLDEVLLLAQTETDLRVFLIMDISNGADKVMVKPNIKRLSDLNQKCIAVENTALGAFMLHQLLNAAELDVANLDIQAVTIDRQLLYMTNNDCDAVVTFEPTATNLAALGYVEIFNSRQIPGKIVDVLVTREAIIKQQEDNLNALVAAQWQALTYIQKYPDDAYQLIVPRLNISTVELEAAYQDLTLPDKKQNQLLLDRQNSDGLNTTIGEISSILHQANLLHRTPTTDQLTTDKFIH